MLDCVDGDNGFWFVVVVSVEVECVEVIGFEQLVRVFEFYVNCD